MAKKVAKLKLGDRVDMPPSKEGEKSKPGIVVAINTEADEIRVAPEEMLHALPKYSAAELAGEADSEASGEGAPE